MSKCSTITREKINCPVFGVPSILKENVLPTYADVMRFCNWLRYEKKTSSNQEPAFSKISEEVAQNLLNLWQKASIPTISHQRIISMLNCYHEKYKNFKKANKHRKGEEKHKTKLQEFIKEAENKLFDISACKCDLSFPNSCTCKKNRKVPAEERSFLLDQRSERKMFIGNLDVITTKMEKKLLRKTKIKESTVTTQSASSSQIELEASFASDSESDICGDNEIISGLSSEVKSKQMRTTLPSLAAACDRYHISNRAAATIASAVLQDVGLIHPGEHSQIIDKSKVRREIKKTRMSNKGDLSSITLHALYFNGRKDNTLMQVKKGEKYYRQTINEEHITLVQEPEGKYIGHITPKSGSAKNIKEGICGFLEEEEINKNYLKAIGCDGTIINTGSKGGVIRLIEQYLGRSLQWIVCLLHFNELPLRHLFQHLDGATTGPRGFAGPIGKELENCQTLPVVSFQTIESKLHELSNDIIKDLSKDQEYLYQLCRAVSSGECSVDLSLRDPGKLSHSRWLTTANRILRLYISTDQPPRELRQLAEFIIKVYAPMWFQIKCNPLCKDGARHVWRIIDLARYLPVELKEIIHKVVQRNAFFAHPENLLLAMLSDDRRHVRELAIRRIIKSRCNRKSEMRQFEIPTLNFNCEDYIDLIWWEDCTITEPPITTAYSKEEMQQFFLETQGPQEILSSSSSILPAFPCHTQNVERAVKLVTESSASVCGDEARHGFILTTLESRKKNAKF